MLKRYCFLICLAFLASASPIPTTQAAPLAVGLPPGFVETTLFNIFSPTALAFLPDGNLLVASQPGSLRLYRPKPSPTLTQVLNLNQVICNDFHRGLLGVAVDPNFSTNRYIYLYYTFNKFNAPNSGECSHSSPTDPVNRVSRFILPASGIIQTTTETVLVDNIPSVNGTHNAGGLQFDPNGLLYISAGDGGCKIASATDCYNRNDNSRYLDQLAGKMLRIYPDGRIPADNPYASEPTARRCGDPAGFPTGSGPCQEIFAHGLRQPYQFSFKPNTSEFYINDVGQDTWEEISLGQLGADYGWNLREGHCITASSTNCPPPAPGLTDPIYDYNHNTGCAAATASAFVPSGVWPTGYDNLYLFGDFVCATIFKLTPTDTGFTATAFYTDAVGITTMAFGPYSDTQALYYGTLLGQVKRIVYTGWSNQPPSARLAVDTAYGNTPLTVTLTAEGSFDPENKPMTFDWDLGDGEILTTTNSVTLTHMYSMAGVYTATLTIRDELDALSEPAQLRLDVGNFPPAPRILTPLTTTRFVIGQPLQLSGEALDTDEGALAGSALTWQIFLRHIDEVNSGNAHSHPLIAITSGYSLTFLPPPPEDFRATALSHLVLQLTATDAWGLARTVTQTLEPSRMPLTFTTQPLDLNLLINSDLITTPHTLTSWEGYEFEIAAPEQKRGEPRWVFEQWSDQGATTHRISTSPITTTYTALFQPYWDVWLPWASW